MAAESIVSSVVEKLGNLVIEEGKFLYGVSEQVEQMQIELELMQTYLEDADRKQSQDKRVKAWVSRIREAAYDVEDVIETFALKIESRRRGGSLKNAIKRYACIMNEAAELHEVGSKIEAIKSRISNLTRCLDTYGIKNITVGEESSRSMQLQQLRRSYSHVVEEYTVGLEKDVKELVGKLVNEKKQYRVVSICGMGGQGKTTLAKKVYHHGKIRRYFDCCAWAFVSQQFQPRNIWEGILCELVSASIEQRKEILKYKDAEIAKKLYEVQQEKNCLVILDDIWTPEAWNSLRHAFPVEKAAGSKILLTTRIKEVVMHVDPRGLHEPHNLTQEEGWELLKKKASPQDSGMEELGRQMVERCGRSPLAIIVLGGLLATKPTLYEWKAVLENFSSYLRKSKGHEQQHSHVYEVLALTYDELPYQLKPCFLHLGHFPEGFDIPTKKLVRMWVAEGIVSPMQYEVEGEKTLEDVAEHCLGQLLDRCIVQVGKRGLNGRIKTCRLHDLMRDLCLLKANEENFLQIVHNQVGNESMNGSISSMVTITKQSHRIRRLAIHVGDQNSSWECERTPNLRSLLFFSPHDSHTLILEKMISRINACKLLKTLDLEECHTISGKLPKAIGKLIHLRYLSLNCSHKIIIPSSIGNLRCLQILILRCQYYSLKVPNVLWKMEWLRHLYLPFNITIKESSGKLRLGNLSELQTLKHLDARIFDLKELPKLTNLRNLHPVGKIEKLPEYHQFPPNLTNLTLLYSKLKEDPMATLEKLPNLNVLRLSQSSFIGKKMICSGKGFLQLKSLVLKQLYNLEEWAVGEEAMPNLNNLVIYNCLNLKMIPEGLRFITTLRELKIIEMPQVFENRLIEGGEDFSKVQHVPSIHITNHSFVKTLKRHVEEVVRLKGLDINVIQKAHTV